MENFFFIRFTFRRRYFKRDISEKKSFLKSKMEKLSEEKRKNEELLDKGKKNLETEMRMKKISNFLEMEAFKKDSSIPDEIIEEYVEKIIYYGDYFEWYLKMPLEKSEHDNVFKIKKSDNKEKKYLEKFFLEDEEKLVDKLCDSLKISMCYDECHTGSNQQ